MILGYFFYNFVLLYFEIFYFQYDFDRVEYMILIPIIYSALHLLLERVKQCFLDLNKYFVTLLALMSLISLIGFIFDLTLKSDDQFLRLIFFVLNNVLYQKLVFTQVVVFLLKMFDIGIVKLRNQMNSNLLIYIFNNYQV